MEKPINFHWLQYPTVNAYYIQWGQSVFEFELMLLYYNARTATGMDGTLHTDFQKSETSRDIKIFFNMIWTSLKVV
jgi:hypothetical protein